MNDKTSELLQQLATKLGTTIEHLWAVLIRQAYISAITDLIQDAIIISVVIVAYRLTVKWLSSKGDTSWDDWLDDRIPTLIVAVAGWGILGIFLVALFLCFPETLTKFINPEYWALQQVLSRVN